MRCRGLNGGLMVFAALNWFGRTGDELTVF